MFCYKLLDIWVRRQDKNTPAVLYTYSYNRYLLFTVWTHLIHKTFNTRQFKSSQKCDAPCYQHFALFTSAFGCFPSLIEPCWGKSPGFSGGSERNDPCTNTSLVCIRQVTFISPGSLYHVAMHQGQIPHIRVSNTAWGNTNIHIMSACLVWSF